MKNIKYILMVLLGGTLYGTMSSFVKLSYSRGFTSAEISFAQATLSALILGAYTFITTKSNIKSLTRRGFLQLLFTGAVIGLTNFLYYLSVNYISASLAIVILMQFTWFSLLLEWLVFSKRPSLAELLTVFFILIGTVMAGNIFYAKSLAFSLKGVLFALLASMTYAVYIVANGSVGKEVDWQSKSAVIMIGSALAIFMVSGKTIITHNHFGGQFLLWAMFFAVVGTTIPTALFSIGISRVGAGVSSILMTVELPVAIICASVVLNERISPLQVGGIIIMLAAIIAMNYYKSKQNRQQ